MSTSKIAMEEPMITKSMTMEMKKITTKKILEKLVKTLLYKDLMERKIPTLPSFLVYNWSNKQNYTTWALQIEAILESYDLAFMVLQDFPHPMVQIVDNLDDEESSTEWSESKLQEYKLTP